jgi:hypothetical protein
MKRQQVLRLDFFIQSAVLGGQALVFLAYAISLITREFPLLFVITIFMLMPIGAYQLALSATAHLFVRRNKPIANILKMRQVHFFGSIIFLLVFIITVYNFAGNPQTDFMWLILMVLAQLVSYFYWWLTYLDWKTV